MLALWQPTSATSIPPSCGCRRRGLGLHKKLCLNRPEQHKLRHDVRHLRWQFHEKGVNAVGISLRLRFRGLFASYLMWMSTGEMLDDVADFVAQSTLESSRRMEIPSTNKSLPERRQGMSNRS